MNENSACVFTLHFCDQSSLAKIQEAPIDTINFKQNTNSVHFRIVEFPLNVLPNFKRILFFFFK